MVPIIQGMEPKSNLYAQQIGQGLGGGLSQGLTTALNQMFEQKQRRQQLQGLAPIFEQFGLPQEGVNALLESGLDPKIIASMAGQLGQQQARLGVQQEKQRIKEQESIGKGQTILDITKEMESLHPYTGEHKVPFFPKSFLGAGPIPLNRESAEKRNQYDTMALSLEGFLRDMTTKGQLPQKTFQTLLERLPHSSLSDRENQGRLNAIRKIVQAQLKNKSTQLNRVERGTALSDEQATEIFEKAGRDPKKARKLAEQLGYSWE